MIASSPSDAFSRVAPSYDDDFGPSGQVPELRRRVLEVLRKHAPPGTRVLEIGAGTGEDAKTLQGLGYSVVASDVSPGMLEQASRKLSGTPVQLLALSAEMIPETFPPGSFDVLFSNFGPLNCVADFQGLLPKLSRVVAPGGIMVVCLMGRYSLWEITSAITRLRFRGALRRVSRGAVLARVGEGVVPVWYHSLSAVRAACKGWGEVVDVVGLNVVSPPPGSRTFPRRFPRVTSLLDRLDHRVGRFPLMSTLGDHLVVVIRRTQPVYRGNHDR